MLSSVCSAISAPSVARQSAAPIRRALSGTPSDWHAAEHGACHQRFSLRTTTRAPSPALLCHPRRMPFEVRAAVHDLDAYGREIPTGMPFAPLLTMELREPILGHTERASARGVPRRRGAVLIEPAVRCCRSSIGTGNAAKTQAYPSRVAGLGRSHTPRARATASTVVSSEHSLSRSLRTRERIIATHALRCIFPGRSCVGPALRQAPTSP